MVMNPDVNPGDYMLNRDEFGYEVFDNNGNSIAQQSGQGGASSTTPGPEDTVGLEATCAAAQANVTFTVNTANITVGENGMYLGGGVFGGVSSGRGSQSTTHSAPPFKMPTIVPVRFRSTGET